MCSDLLKKSILVLDWAKAFLKMMNQGPNLKEKSILLVKMTPNVEKRFTDDADLNAQVLLKIHII